MSALFSIPIASYCSIERLGLIYFHYAQQDHKLNETGIKYVVFTSLTKLKANWILLNSIKHAVISLLVKSMQL